MSHLRDPNKLTPDEIEAIERQSLRCLYTAAFDFGFDAFDIFEQSSDDPKDIAEDITREILDKLGGYQVQPICTNCNEGLQNTALPKPDQIHLLYQARRATINNQRVLLNWLLNKFNLVASPKS